MAANIITLARMILAVIVLVLFEGGFPLRCAAVILTVIVIYMDSLDGFVARKLGVASDFGALFDITGDRIVEFLFWIFFAVKGLVLFWVPAILLCRSFLVDTLRNLAFAKEGKTPFGEKSMMRSPLTRFLTASPVSRSAYAVGKGAAFVLLGVVLALQGVLPGYMGFVSEDFFGSLIIASHALVWIVVGMNLARGIPVLLDGRTYLFQKWFPKELKDAE